MDIKATATLNECVCCGHACIMTKYIFNSSSINLVTNDLFIYVLFYLSFASTLLALVM